MTIQDVVDTVQMGSSSLCCRVLQCVKVRCSLLQCVVECCSATRTQRLHDVDGIIDGLVFIVLRSVDLLQCVVVCCSVSRTHDTIRRDVDGKQYIYI